MAPSVNPGEPKEAPKPEPIGNAPIVVLFTICTLCAIFILWRRASAIRAVVGHQLKTWTRQEGTIRLSLDDAPAAREFLDDDYDEDNAGISDDEPLALRAQQLRPQRNDSAVIDSRREQMLPAVNESSTLFQVDEDDIPPPPPPKN